MARTKPKVHDDHWSPYDPNWGSLVETEEKQLNQKNYYKGNTPGDNTRYTKFLVELQKISLKADRTDVTSMQKCFVEYLQLCAEWDIKIGNLNAYMAMGIDAATASAWYNGQAKADQPEYKQLITDVKRMCGAYREMLISDGKLNPVTGIFWQKNYDGLQDVTSHQVTAVNALGDFKDAADIMEKYQMLPDD